MNFKKYLTYISMMALGAVGALAIQCSHASPNGSSKLAGKLKGPAPAAVAGITLNTPVVQTHNYMTVVSMQAQFGVSDANTLVRLVYAPCDVNGIPIPGQPKIPVVLSAQDIQAMQQTPGSLRMQAYAALQSNQAELAGVSK